MDKDELLQARTESPLPHSEPSSSQIKIIFFVSVVVFVLGLFLTLLLMMRPPKAFPVEHIYVLESGSTVRDVSQELKEQNIIRYSRLFEIFIMIRGNKAVKAGDYLFERPESVMRIAERVTHGEYGDSRKRIVLHEGLTVRQMSEILEEQFEGFSSEKFERLAKDDEGYLFPDTYFFFPSANTEYIYNTIRSAFDTQIKDFLTEIEASGRTLEEIITMASIIEREAGSNKLEQKIISGILWKRIKIGMPLQVDAPFVYILGKGSAQLTRSDLEEDSPYNTYTNKGLPPGPIGNPGRSAIEAAIHPSETEYLFYLHGQDGMVRYAVDHDGHVINKNSYLP